jgi:hypothetical protein
VTLSILKTDVWDRRYGVAPTLTLDEIRAGVFSAANKGFDDMPPGQRRPVRGWVKPEGGREDRYACWNAYPFPCEKPVGQIILQFDELAGIAAPPLTQSCANGGTRIQLRSERAQSDLQVVLSMTRNVFAIRGKVAGVGQPRLRLYRHEDQAWRRYMTPDKKGFRARTPGGASGPIAVGEIRPTQIPFDYAKDAAWNGPVEPPTSGTDGRYFWIHQRFPAEKTFPQGFDYVLMGVIPGKAKPHIDVVEGKTGLGTAAYGLRGDVLTRLEDGYRAIREAPGAAATASLTPDSDGNVTAFVTVVTCNDTTDPFGEARRQLDAAMAAGFENLVAENAAWYQRLYEQRENGRVFVGREGRAVTDDVREIFRSWYCQHGGANQPDMRRFEATAYYANVEQDWQLWHSLPCYNEPFYTGAFVRNRADSVDLWWKIVGAWLPAARANAREVYGAQSGMALVHGYVPPVKPDRYVHTNVALEFCIDTIGQVVKVLWEKWDYGADEVFLREHAYPALREAADFYASYAQPGPDGRYHFIPSVEAEAWGIFPEFARAKDCISALAMARWAFLRAGEAATHLGVDTDRRIRWHEVEAKLAPYPVYATPDGPVFNTVADTVPGWKQGDHWFIANYLTVLADEINLDSPAPLRTQMLRTVRQVPTPRDPLTLVLLGATPRLAAGAGRSAGPRESAPTTEAQRLAADVRRFPEKLLNSRGGRIHLFPDVRATDVVAFRGFQARGGFLVSGARDTTGVTQIEIGARRDLPCAVINPWPGRVVIVRDAASGARVPFTLNRDRGECVVFGARAGTRYTIACAGE